MKMLGTWAAGIILIYVAICILLFLFQKHLVYFPVKKFDFSPQQYGLVYEDLFIQTSDGVKINAWFIPADTSRGVVLFCHGNAGNISHRLESVSIFNRLSLDVLIFDYRGYGRSEGSPDEEGTYQDGQACWEYLVNRKAYKPDQIIIFGRSLGTGIASWIAKENKPGMVILESSYTSLPDLGAKIYPFFPVRLLSRINYPTGKHLQNINCPKLFIHSKGDEIIPFTLGYQNYQLASEPKQFLEIHGSHNDGFFVSGEIYKNGINDFLIKYL